LATLGKGMFINKGRNPERVASKDIETAIATLSGLLLMFPAMPLPRVAKAQPWAGISERFQRNEMRRPYKTQSLPQVLTSCHHDLLIT
jgi:hypothetical protein